MHNKSNPAERYAPADFFVEGVEKVIFSFQRACIGGCNCL